MKNNFYQKIFCLGLLIRLILMPFFGHWDLTSLHQVASAGPSRFYDFSFSIYPPLTYYLLIIWQKIISFFVSFDFFDLLNLPNIVSFTSSRVFRHLFLLKSLHLFFDLPCAFLLKEILKSETKKKMAFALWMLNPILLYTTYMWGTVDVLVSFFLLFCLFLALKGRVLLGAFSLGVSAAFKIFPLVFLPFYLVTAFKKAKERFLGLVLGALPFFLSSFYHWRDIRFFKQVLLSDRSRLLSQAGIYIGADQFLMVFFLFYFLFLFWSWEKLKGRRQLLPICFFLIFLSFYGLVAFTPQWFLWGLPLFILVFSSNPFLWPGFLLIFLVYFLLVFSFEISLNLGLLAPIERTVLEWPSFGDILGQFLSINFIRSFLRTFLASLFFWLAFQLNKKGFFHETHK